MKREWVDRGRVDRLRPGARQRGYDNRWEKAANQYRWRNPDCIGCAAIGIKRKATVVDHVVPHKGDQVLFWGMYNWQPVCDWHHRTVKQELERRYFRGEIRAADLVLTSAVAVAITIEKHRPATGLDGFAIAGS